jgi:hypothetical protein
MPRIGDDGGEIVAVLVTMALPRALEAPKDAAAPLRYWSRATAMDRSDYQHPEDVPRQQGLSVGESMAAELVHSFAGNRDCPRRFRGCLTAGALKRLSVACSASGAMLLVYQFAAAFRRPVAVTAGVLVCVAVTLKLSLFNHEEIGLLTGFATKPRKK